MTCNVEHCIYSVRFIVQSPKQKLNTCEEHLLRTIEDARGIEFYVVKIDVV